MGACFSGTSASLLAPASPAAAAAAPPEPIAEKAAAVEEPKRAPRVGLLYDPLMALHRNLESTHPEQPDRIKRIFEALTADGLVERCVRIPCRAATREELETKHTARHVDSVLCIETMSEAQAIQESRKYNSIFLCPQSTQAGLLSAGSVLEATARVCSGEVASAVCVVRPPGHHAESDCCMGFCLFGNVALAAAEARRKGWSNRALIVDWDVHHGNGTQHMFEDDDSVLYFSTHRYDGGSFFPGGFGGHFISHGKGKGEGFSVNVPFDVKGGMRRGCKPFADAEMLEAWKCILLPICKEFQPDLIFISAGFDAAQGDPLGGCGVTPAGYFELTKLLMTVVPGGSRIVLALEGGYNLESISSSMAACMHALLGDAGPGGVVAAPFDRPQAFHADTVEEVREHMSKFWPSLKSMANSARVPKTALEGSWFSMQLELQNHAEATGGDLVALSKQHEAICFKLEDLPALPLPSGRSKALQQSFALDTEASPKGKSSPLLVPILHIRSPEQAVETAGLAFAAGVHGLWLVNRGHAYSPENAGFGMPFQIYQTQFKNQRDPKARPGSQAKAAQDAGNAQLRALAECFAAVRARFKDEWIGLVVPQLPCTQAFSWVADHCSSADGLWLQDLAWRPALLEFENERAVRLQRWCSHLDQTPDFKSIRRAKQACGWLGLVFGSVAVDGQQPVHHEQEGENMGEASRALLCHWAQIMTFVCDVIVTSCPAELSAGQCAKLHAMAPARPLALHCPWHSGQQGAASDRSTGPLATDLVMVDLAIGISNHGGEESLLELDGAKLSEWISSWK